MDSLEVDTIVAISTAPGSGAIAVIRVSGPAATAVLARVAPGLRDVEPRRMRLAAIADPRTGEAIDRALVVLHPGPGSYTGEDLVEISGHGGWLGPALVLDACVAAGARQAEPGEFTRRAYLNGRMDLTQAEAVADLVDGRSRAARRAALSQLDRGLARRVLELRSSLLGIEALLAHHLDFPEEDDPPVPTARIGEAADGVATRLEALIATAPEGELLREGALAVIAGRTNSGKSSLFNALLGQERAIVTELPGTTRDALEASVSLGGYPFRLVDTAGLRESEERVERLGIEVARRYLAAADVVLLCVEDGREPEADERAFAAEADGRPVVLVRTKTDLAERGDAATEGLAVSAFSGVGLDALRAELAARAFSGLVRADADAPVLTRARQAAAARVARDEVRAFAGALRAGVGAEVAAAHLGAAEGALEEIVGTITSEDVLDRLFRDFCIGK